mmetsp:Transcript_30712/g.52531  ORF Transcript_30712/g.52531 Transcript_30712/m.52531 type:complete len:535 (-) Transcript_30712:413-2017(-)
MRSPTGDAEGSAPALARAHAQDGHSESTSPRAHSSLPSHPPLITPARQCPSGLHVLAEHGDELGLLHAPAALGGGVDAPLLELLPNLLHRPALVVLGVALLGVRALALLVRARQHLLREPALGVERRLRARARRGDGLAVDPVGHVASGKHAVDRALGRAGLCDEVAVVRHVELAAEEARVRDVPDGHEGCLRRHLGHVGRVGRRFDDHGGQDAAIGALELLDGGVPHHGDLRVGEHRPLQHRRRAEGVAPVDERHRRRRAREDERVLHRRVAAADHDDRLRGEEEAVARRARRDAASLEVLLARHGEPAAVGARGDHDRLRRERRVVRLDHEGALRQVDLEHLLLLEGGGKLEGLPLHELDDVAAARLEDARVVFHGHALRHELPARRRRDDHRLQASARRVDGGGHAGGAASNDGDLDWRGRRDHLGAAPLVLLALQLRLLLLHHKLPPVDLRLEVLHVHLLDVGHLLLRRLLRRAGLRLGWRGLLGVLGRLAVLLLQDLHELVRGVLLVDVVDGRKLRGVLLLVKLLQRAE